MQLLGSMERCLRYVRLAVSGRDYGIDGGRFRCLYYTYHNRARILRQKESWLAEIICNLIRCLKTINNQWIGKSKLVPINDNFGSNNRDAVIQPPEFIGSVPFSECSPNGLVDI